MRYTRSVSGVPSDVIKALDCVNDALQDTVGKMKKEINAYFEALAVSAQELRRHNSPLNDAEIISGKYNKDIQDIINKYLPKQASRKQ